MKAWLAKAGIEIGIKFLLGALKSDKEDLKGKVVDGLKKIPDDVLEKGITEMTK